MSSVVRKEERNKRAKVVKLEEQMRGLASELDAEDPTEITHHFAPGVYLREMFAPKDSVIVGKIHKTEHFCILAQGKLLVSDGENKTVVEAPAVVRTPIGAKRAAVALTDITWINIHPSPAYGNEHTDVKQIERDVIIDSFEELDKFLENESRKLLPEDEK